MVIKTTIPASIGGLVLGLVDAKLPSGVVGRTIVKAVIGALWGGFMGRFLGEAGAAAGVATVMGSIGHEFGLRLGGGIVTTTKKEGVKELVEMAADDAEIQGHLAALATEDVSYDGTRLVSSLGDYEQMAAEDDNY